MWQMVYETYCLVKEGVEGGICFFIVFGDFYIVLKFYVFSFFYLSHSVSLLNNDNHGESIYMGRCRILHKLGCTRSEPENSAYKVLS